MQTTFLTATPFLNVARELKIHLNALANNRLDFEEALDSLPPPSVASSHHSRAFTPPHANAHLGLHASLQKLEIQQFSGNLAEYNSFWLNSRP